MGSLKTNVLKMKLSSRNGLFLVPCLASASLVAVILYWLSKRQDDDEFVFDICGSNCTQFVSSNNTILRCLSLSFYNNDQNPIKKYSLDRGKYATVGCSKEMNYGCYMIQLKAKRFLSSVVGITSKIENLYSSKYCSGNWEGEAVTMHPERGAVVKTIEKWSRS